MVLMAEVEHRSVRSRHVSRGYGHRRRRSRSALLGWVLLVVPCVGVAVWLVVPRLHWRMPSPITLCRANFVAIRDALLAHAKENGGAFPPTLDVLVKAGDVAPVQLICAEGKGRYVYVGGQTTQDDPTDVLMYDPPSTQPSQYGYVLFVDGRVETLTSAELRAALGRATTRETTAATRPATREARTPVATRETAQR